VTGYTAACATTSDIMFLKNLISPALLRKMAGPASYARGEAYLAKGAVRKLDCTGEAANAIVQGNEPYRVLVWSHAGKLEFSCSCPFASDMGACCKHFVAVGLALAGAPMPEPAGAAQPAGRHDAWTELGNYLRRRDVDTLAQWLLDAARNDPQLQRKLMGHIAPVAFDESALRKLIERSTDVPDYVSWDEANDVVAQLQERLEELLHARTVATAPRLVPLLEHAFERLDRVLELVDDRSGFAADVLTGLGEAHAETCELAGVDPETLAGRLFELAINSASDLWDFGPNDYAAALGEAGRQRYREILQAAWKAQGQNNRPTGTSSIIDRFMLELADGDVDMTVDILSRDLGGVHRYRRIAETLHGAGRIEQAIDWVRRGLEAWPDRLDRTLCNMLVEHDLAKGQGAQAIALRFRQLAQAPALEAYQALAATAQVAGEWPACRERAWETIADCIRKAGITGRTLHVAIALWERDIDLAREHANAGECAPDELHALAQALEPDWPDEAFEYYRRLVHHAMESGRGAPNDVYAEAFGNVQCIVRLLDRLDRAVERARYIAHLRIEYKRKRNFVKLLDTL
jgi:uncharacterized Zn finger protein